MATIETDADVVRVIRENPRILFRALHEDPELLAEVRRLVLTDEVIAMPAQLAEVIERQDRTEGQLTEVIRIQNALLETQNKILADQDEMRQTQNALLETQNKLLEGQDEMRGDIKALHGMYRRQHDDLGRFRGKYAADAARKHTFKMAQIFAQLRGYNRIISLKRLSEDERNELLGQNYDAVEALGFHYTTWDTFRVADVMVEVTELRGSKPAFYVTAEASFTGDREDARRAAEHAIMLRRATGQDAYAVVAAVRIAQSAQGLFFRDAARFIEAGNDDDAFWYQFDERDLEPPDAC